MVPTLPFELWRIVLKYVHHFLQPDIIYTNSFPDPSWKADTRRRLTRNALLSVSHVSRTWRAILAPLVFSSIEIDILWRRARLAAEVYAVHGRHIRTITSSSQAPANGPRTSRLITSLSKLTRHQLPTDSKTLSSTLLAALSRLVTACTQIQHLYLSFHPDFHHQLAPILLPLLSPRLHSFSLSHAYRDLRPPYAKALKECTDLRVLHLHLPFPLLTYQWNTHPARYTLPNPLIRLETLELMWDRTTDTHLIQALPSESVSLPSLRALSLHRTGSITLEPPEQTHLTRLLRALGPPLTTLSLRGPCASLLPSAREHCPSIQRLELDWSPTLRPLSIHLPTVHCLALWGVRLRYVTEADVSLLEDLLGALRQPPKTICLADHDAERDGTMFMNEYPVPWAACDYLTWLYRCGDRGVDVRAASGQRVIPVNFNF